MPGATRGFPHLAGRENIDDASPKGVIFPMPKQTLRKTGAVPELAKGLMVGLPISMLFWYGIAAFVRALFP
jgi:hypothetical protein